MTSKPLQNSLTFPMQRGPFQSNGASPWYCPLKLGTPAQSLKFSLDTGTNMSWVTSTLCPTDQCKHFAGRRFDTQASSTFVFTDCLRRPYSFGPWGTMQVEAACDVLTLPNDARLDSPLFLAAAYEGEQFKQLDWDGGLGLPCSSAYVEGRSSFVFQALLREGQLDPTQPFVAFDWDAGRRTGSCRMGAIDSAKIQGPHLFLPWCVYTELPGVEYIWSTELKSYSVGSEKLRANIKFALDSGSSQFKGDDALMRETLARIAHSDQPDILLEFADGEITLGSELYNCLIEAGPKKDQVLPQFAPMGLTDLVVVGSLVMEHCYTVYEYQVVKCGHEVYSLAPVGIWLFNRADGPQIITRSSCEPFMPGARAVLDTKLTLPGPTVEATTVAGTWTNDYGSMMTLDVSGPQVTGTYQSSTGSTGEYSITGCLSGTAATRAKSQALAFAIEWHDLRGTKKDPSWNWTSGFSGQLSVTDKGDVLTLNHLLVATSDFPELASQGTYIDKLVYTRAEQQTSARTSAEIDPVPIENTLAGHWVAANGASLVLSVHSDSMQRFGIVQGFFRNQEASAKVTGFTDIHAQASNLSHQSVSLTIATDQDNRVRAICGALDLTADILRLLVLVSSPVAPAHAYLATQISSLHFTRLSMQLPAATD